MVVGEANSKGAVKAVISLSKTDIGLLLYQPPLVN